MKGFVSYAAPLAEMLKGIVADDALHAKWLNTLSYLENCGARKIAACEHPTLVKEEMLKHASEEFRHAHYLKRQIEKVSHKSMDSYCVEYMLGGSATLHYLSSLDVKVSRYLKDCGLTGHKIKEAAYLLVTYAIELRADELYSRYDEVLKAGKSKVAVKSILLEEEEHLNEMIAGLKNMPSGFEHAEHACAIESALCCSWLTHCKKPHRDL